LKETVLGLGVILLFTGIIVLPWSIQATTTPDPITLASEQDLVYPDWSISGRLNQSDVMAVYFTAPSYENIPEPTGERYMFVNVTDPQGGTTVFNITFTKKSFFRGVTSNDGGLIIDNPNFTEYLDIGGTARYTGLYTVKVYPIVDTMVQYYYPHDGELQVLQVVKIVVRTDYPYIVALPVSASLVVVGLALTAWGARRPKRRTRSKRI
jgi:hypothetical protein